jgi:hypothetical protein
MTKIISVSLLSPFAQKVFNVLRGYGLAVFPIEPDSPIIKQKYASGIKLPSGFKYHFSKEINGRPYFKIRVYHLDGTLMQTFSVEATLQTREYEETEEGVMRRKERIARLNLGVYLRAEPIMFYGLYDSFSIEPWPGSEDKYIYLYVREGREYGEPVIYAIVSNID